MPVPIRPVNDYTLSTPDKNQYLIDLDTLSKAIGAPPSRQAHVRSPASDEEADVLFGVWQKLDGEGTPVGVDGTKQYAIPPNVSQSDIMRLKAAGLISGDANHVKLTPAGVGVIRLMVLSEENSFRQQAVRKPYTQILADSVRSKSGGPMLAVASCNCADLSTRPMIKEATRKPANVLPPGNYPQGLSSWVESSLIQNTSGGSSKEVLIRVYTLPGNMYATVCWTGRIGGTLRAQTKYVGDSVSEASMVARQMQNAELEGGYERVPDNHREAQYGSPATSERPSAARPPAERAPASRPPASARPPAAAAPERPASVPPRKTKTPKEDGPESAGSSDVDVRRLMEQVNEGSDEFKLEKDFLS